MAIDKDKLTIVGNIAGLMTSRIVTMKMLTDPAPAPTQLPQDLVDHIAAAEQIYNSVYVRCEVETAAEPVEHPEL